MESRTLALAGAIVFAAFAVTAMAIEAARSDPAPAETIAPAPVAEPVADPLRDALARCQRLGEAGGRDPACLAAWAENRRRFIGGR